MRASDDWYEAEESTRRGMIAEVQRIRRRLRVRPLPVLALAAAITGLLAWKLVTHKALVEAEIVLALTEGSLSAKHNGVPVDQLREYVDGVLLPDVKLRELIERRDLYKLRNTLGEQYAIDQLRGQLDVQIWKNTFVYYDEDAEHAEHSARIGLTVSDTDPDRAFDIARDLAAIVIQSAQEHRKQLSTELSGEIASMREGLTRRLVDLERERSEKTVAVTKARGLHKDGVVQAMTLELAEIDQETKRAEKTMAEIATSSDALADRISAAGLDMSVQVVEEHRPERPEHRGFVLAMALVVVGFGALLGSALLVGSFDSRIHDTDDVARLGLPVLGHVPGFAGDHVGSLAARGVSHQRVPSRWRTSR